MMGEAGLAQAQAAARRLMREELEFVATSPLERTRQTAEPIARACGVRLKEEPALMEIDFGDWNGADFEALEREALWVQWNARRDQTRPPGGETMAEVQARLSAWLAKLVRENRRSVAAVSHADVIKCAALLALGLSASAHDRFEIGPGSITTLVAGTWGLKLHSLNETPYA